MFTAGYARWMSDERPHLMRLAKYTVCDLLESDPIPKLSSVLEKRLMRKIRAPSLREFRDDGAQPVYIHHIVRYFVKAISFVPAFVDSKGKRGKSDDYKEFRFSRAESNSILATLNASLFYWFWRTFSDGFHCGYGDVYRMPYPGRMGEPVKSRLKKLQKALTTGLRRGSVEKAVTTKTGRIRYQEFYPRATKPIIDEIDCVLARHYGFTDEELDFIINYDIKYRMGLAGGGDSSEEDSE